MTFSPEEIALAERLFDLQPESPWTAFLELGKLFGDMPLEKKQMLYDFVAERRRHGKTP